ncbi:MAG TPA: hypothetical protein VF179_12755 [Thermoanaerobaculia bacterium]|nr:hypothetical protein [Thermoanaerobaculia bacterium]
MAPSPGSALQKRRATWSETNPEGRWRSYSYEDLEKRDKLDLDLSWIKDRSLTDAESLPPLASWPRRSQTTWRQLSNCSPKSPHG